MNDQSESITGLDEIDIIQWNESEVSRIYPTLKAEIFYRTNIDGYLCIKADGFICSNKGKYPFTYPQTEYSFGFNKGYISLFDFKRATYKECIITHDTWGPFLSDQNPITIILKLEQKKLLSKLIPNSEAPRVGDKKYKIYIPFVEAWYPYQIPFNFIKSFCLSVYDQKKHKLIFNEFPISQRNIFEEIIDRIKVHYH